MALRTQTGSTTAATGSGEDWVANDLIQLAAAPPIPPRSYLAVEAAYARTAWMPRILRRRSAPEPDRLAR